MHCAMLSYMASHNDLIGSAEACRLLGIDSSTLTRWVVSGKVVAAHKLPGRTGAYLYHRADIEALVDDEKSA